MQTSALERFLRYVQIDTRSNDRRPHFAQHAGQLVLLNLLLSEVARHGRRGCEHRRIRRADGDRAGDDEPPRHSDDRLHCPRRYVTGNAWRQREADCASACDGRDLVLPDDPVSVLRLADNPSLAACIGEDIVTASGLTLLGADDKAGVAEIMAAAEYLMAHPEIAHGPVRIAFTPDEEIGRGTTHFDVARFGARCAYTLDGGSRGELEVENFSADAMTFTFRDSIPIPDTRRSAWSMRSRWRPISSRASRETRHRRRRRSTKGSHIHTSWTREWTDVGEGAHP